MSLKGQLVRSLPGPVEQALRKLLRRPAYEPEGEGEKPAEWYDRAFEETVDYRTHYTRSPYYPSWTVIIDRIRRAEAKSVLEVACGPGQLACALRDSGLLDHYCGFDFAEKRIAAARMACPGFVFEVADAFTTPLFSDVPYEAVVATEFLEHVNDDLNVLARIRPGTRFIGTVPNYPYASHVRHFTDESSVLERYAPYFEGFTVDPIVRDARGHVLFLMEGITQRPTGGPTKLIPTTA